MRHLMTNQILRAFQIRSGNKSGTATVVDIDQKQYLVSAAHVCETAAETLTLDIFYGDKWTPVSIDIVAFELEIDLAVFSLKFCLVDPKLEVFISSGDIAFGEQGIFLGFPLLLRGANLPQEQVPSAVFNSCRLAFMDNTAFPKMLFVSALAPPGFSGGPVFFPNIHSGQTQLAAIVIEALGYEVEVKNEKDVKIGSVTIDSGLVKCVRANDVVEVIRRNPKGFDLALAAKK